MGFELNVSVKRDPRERHHPTVAASKASYSEIRLNGTFDAPAADAILERIKLLASKGVPTLFLS